MSKKKIPRKSKSELAEAKAGRNKAAAEASMINLQQFHTDDCHSLIYRFKHIQNLIGLSHHSLTEGEYCEELLRVFLRQVLPQRYSIDTGFIRGHPVEIDGRSYFASPQIDVIIHDSYDYSPMLRSGNFVVVLPDAVEAVIE